MSGLWKHNTHPVYFSLVVDYFLIKYVKEMALNHLLEALQLDYIITMDKEAKMYCGVSLKWDYKDCTCSLSMPGYVEAV